MTVLKWVLLIFGVLFLAVAAAVFGIFYWGSTVESVKLTAADLEVGGSYPDDEREALFAACKVKLGSTSDAETQCRCVADRAGTELSRLSRLELTAGFDGDLTKIVALSKGLMESRIAQTRIDDVETDANQRARTLLASCGIGK